MRKIKPNQPTKGYAMIQNIVKFLLIIGISTHLFSADKDLISIEDYMKFGDITFVSLSPDGKHILASVEATGKKKLVVFDLKNMKPKHFINFDGEDEQVGNFGWINNKRIYYTLEKKVGPLDQPADTGYMFARNIDGSRPAQLMPTKGSAGRPDEWPSFFRIMSMLHNDDEHILIVKWDDGFATAYRLNIYTGRKYKVERSPVKNGGLIADSSGTIRVATGEDYEEELTWIYIKDEKGEWKLFKEFDAKNITLDVLRLGKDEKSLIVESSDSNIGRGIFRLKLADKSLTKILDIDDDAEIKEQITDGDPLKPKLIGIKRMPGYYVTDYFDPSHPMAKTHRSLEKAFPGQEVRLYDFTDDGKSAMVSVRSDTNPGTFYLFDRKTFQVKHLVQTFPWIDRKKLAPMKPISFEARDGLEIRGYLTMPKGKKQAPLVLYVHGGPYGVQDVWGYDNRAQLLASRGYGVLQVNYRGSGGRGASFQYDAYRQVGAEMQDDLTDATLWAIDQGYTNKDKVCIYGGSYGGYAALMGVVREPDLYQCAIGVVGVYDIEVQVDQSDTAESENGRKFLHDAWNAYDEEFVKERSAYYHADKIKAAIFFIHGARDERVPIDNMYRMQKALDKVGHPYETLVKPYEGHGFYDLENRVEQFEKMFAFLEKHIGSKSE
ncbi:S9 family peptidase [Pleionea sediminis]|uniref:S9 family peptidase n=1 Tax=Pleionea sediminis TaxID=2569479 RepID=UPI00118691AE|nr:S9 family peptidase [Pleionea sediminis]